jgi:hypothetical protein
MQDDSSSQALQLPEFASSDQLSSPCSEDGSQSALAPLVVGDCGWSSSLDQLHSSALLRVSQLVDSVTKDARAAGDAVATAATSGPAGAGEQQQQQQQLVGDSASANTGSSGSDESGGDDLNAVSPCSSKKMMRGSWRSHSSNPSSQQR